MHNTAPLKLIFVTLTDEKGNPLKTHVAFYDLFGGIVEVIGDDNAEPDQLGPELIISPINKYYLARREEITLWITVEEKEKIGQAIRDIFDKRDPLAMIFNGKPMKMDCSELTDTGFCVEALRAALPILPKVPVKVITTQKLYTVLKMMGGI